MPLRQEKQLNLFVLLNVLPVAFMNKACQWDENSSIPKTPVDVKNSLVFIIPLTG